MALGDLFKAKKNLELQEYIKKLEIDNQDLKNRISNLESEITPEMLDSFALKNKIEEQKKQIDDSKIEFKKEIDKQLAETKKLSSNIVSLRSQISDLHKELIETDEEVLMQSFSLYRPHFDFANSTQYKDELEKIRGQEKNMIKNNCAATGNSGWTVNGNVHQGAKMIKDMQKLLIRSFNCECDDVVDHVKFNNIESSEKRILTVYSSISKLGSICGVAITGAYRDLKIKELHLAHEYQIEKQKEKERLKELRAEERERAKLEKEIEEARKKLDKEEKHYNNALASIEKQILSASSEQLPDLLEKKEELQSKLNELSSERKEIDYREANQKAGYVYVISNVGAFGENVYKIGMTRRLEPMDRIDELGDASVPFSFDVHALIFSEDAPALETALHHAFEDRKVNMVNTRKEFFHVTLEEIKSVVNKNFDKTVEFVDVAPAEQYRTSQLLRQK